MPASETIWNKDKIAELARLWGSGLSAREIADRLGDEFTRAAVIGKANRLGLARQKPGFTPTDNGRKKPVPRPPPPPQSPSPPRPQSLPLPPERSGPPRMRRLQLLELADHHCRWPMGDPHRPGFYFCGADAPATIYCPQHMRVAFARTRAEI
jgi:GcrA cell cycle regulator